MDIRPGTKVTLEVTALPRSDAGRKTLIRLCRKDPAVVRAQRKALKRNSWETWRRGGRQWHHQMRSAPGVSLTTGSRYSILATVDVLRDLASLARWVKVTPA